MHDKQKVPVLGTFWTAQNYYCPLGGAVVIVGAAPDGLAAPAGRTWILAAVTDPSEFDEPLTTMYWPVVRVLAGTVVISLTCVDGSKSTIFVPVVAEVLVEFAS